MNVFMVVANNDKSKIDNAYAAFSSILRDAQYVIKADLTVDDDSMFKKISDTVCNTVCTFNETVTKPCHRLPNQECGKLAAKVYDSDGKNCYGGSDTEPKLEKCEDAVCDEICAKGSTPWTDWAPPLTNCCGVVGTVIKLYRTRTVPESLANDRNCPSNAFVMCVIRKRCADAVAADLRRANTKMALIYFILAGLLLLVIIIAVVILVLSGRRSRARLQQRLKAGGINVPLDQLKQEGTHDISADLGADGTPKKSGPKKSDSSMAKKSQKSTTSKKSPATGKGAKK